MLVVRGPSPIALSVADAGATTRLNCPSVLKATDAAAGNANLNILMSIAERAGAQALVLRGSRRDFRADGDFVRSSEGVPAFRNRNPAWFKGH
jgi:enoyl-CoA hydratase/carnithine racemase